MRILKLIKNPSLALLFLLGNAKISAMFSDEVYLKLKYRISMGKKLNLENPKTFNEKLQWLKLYNRKPEYTMMVDKYKVRDYISEKIGEEHLIELLGVWDGPDDIDFDKLPDKFVLKCNHNSGLGMCICKDKSKLDIPKVKEELRKGLNQDYFTASREWPYKDVERKIICEKYMVDKTKDGDLTDYKIHCFNGEVKFTLVCNARFSKHGLTEDFYDENWNKINVKRPDVPMGETENPKPEVYDKMIEYAKLLSKNIPFLRVDFYVIEGKIYFGELTFFPASGLKKFEPEKYDEIFGSYLNLGK